MSQLRSHPRSEAAEKLGTFESSVIEDFKFLRMLGQRRLSGLVCILLALFCLVAAPAGASVVGVRISTTSVDNDTGEVMFDLTAFQDINPATIVLGERLDRTALATYTAVLGDYYGLGSISYRVVLGSRSDWNTLPHPAVNFGDGDTIESLTLALQGSATVGGTDLFAYRLGSLSHTYSDGTYLARAVAGPDGGALPGLGRASTAMVATGYPLTGALTNVFSASRVVYPTTNLNTPVYSFRATSVFNYPATLRYITARQDVMVDGGGTGPQPTNPLDVPTLSEASLLVLAALLALSGALLLRRSA